MEKVGLISYKYPSDNANKTHFPTLI